MGHPETSSKTAHHLASAEGWLLLHNPIEALGELQCIPLEDRKDLLFLELNWRLHADLQEWEEALKVATDTSGYILRSYAIRRSKEGSLEAASQALLEAAAKFPKESIIPYNLACYAAQLGNLKEARDFLRMALELGDRQQMIRMARRDEDLKPLWSELIKG
ncbi:MAG: tetratricopeptide repeat protein [Verrucomicrobia bacterium]|nr:tetratricopeptide repeat protein [Verrucomicrobiota bacterium]